MRFIAFHLMPYATPEAIDAIGAKKPENAWVTFSNEHYDPRQGVELYKRYLDELTYAAELGFDGVSVNEHHQNAYGNMPNPNLMASALIQRVPETTKIAVLGNALPLHDPLEIAEQVAMLDVLSGGRVISGFVRGIGFEYTTFGRNPNDSRDRFQEAHDLVVKAWTTPGPFAWHGEHYHYEYLNPWPLPVQEPHPPIWIPSQGSSETVDWAAERRYTYLQTFTKQTRVAQITGEFREAARRHGYEASPDQQGWSIPVYVGETDEQARAEFKPHVETFFNRLLAGPLEVWFPPGYMTPQSFQRAVASRTDLFAHNDHTMEELEEQGLVVVGGPDTVVQKLRDGIDATGVGVLVPVVQLATMPHDLTMASIRRLGEHVLPALRDHVSAVYTGEGATAG
jgi:alkanesulfonate monooxygenase SsuD/methylene tetrahydromethanopterin reductase-like flavin-dependent oxidoreductase (luciferase family)